jgi:hypothetical protein
VHIVINFVVLAYNKIMDIDKKNRQTAIVTFEEVEERRRFGSYAPTFSRERWGAIASRVPVLPTYLYEEFPQTVEISHKLLGRVLGGVATHKQVEGYRIASMSSRMADTIEQYFHELRQQYGDQESP